MAYSWAQLAFVEKWRLHGVRGQIVGMHRPADRTFFDLRLRPSEGMFNSSASPRDLHLLDAGDIIREKRIVLLDKALVVIRVVGTDPADVETAEEVVPGPKRPLQAGSAIAGAVLNIEEDTLLMDVGFPLVVQFPEPVRSIQPGQKLRVALTEAPKGFLVV